MVDFKLAKFGLAVWTHIQLLLLRAVKKVRKEGLPQVSGCGCSAGSLSLPHYWWALSHHPHSHLGPDPPGLASELPRLTVDLLGNHWAVSDPRPNPRNIKRILTYDIMKTKCIKDKSILDLSGNKWEWECKILVNVIFLRFIFFLSLKRLKYSKDYKHITAKV